MLPAEDRTSMKKRICIISFSPIFNDGRVQRQISYLSPYYDLSVVGYGEADPRWKNVHWIPIDRQESLLQKLFWALLLVIARVWAPFYEYYWQRPRYRNALDQIQAIEFDAFYANEWAALPIAVKAAQKTNAPVIYD